jgi:hypothetical protein
LFYTKDLIEQVMASRSLVLLWAISLFLLSACSTLVPKDYVVTKSQLDRTWSKSFPMHRDLGKGVFSATLDAPAVVFLVDQNRVSLGTSLSVSSLFSGSLKGRVAVSGALRYDAEKRALFMQDADLETLEVDQGSPEIGKILRPTLNVMLSEYLRTNPLYQFKEDEMRYAGTEIDIEHIEILGDGIKFHLKPR